MYIFSQVSMYTNWCETRCRLGHRACFRPDWILHSRKRGCRRPRRCWRNSTPSPTEVPDIIRGSPQVQVPGTGSFAIALLYHINTCNASQKLFCTGSNQHHTSGIKTTLVMFFLERQNLYFSWIVASGSWNCGLPLPSIDVQFFPFIGGHTYIHEVDVKRDVALVAGSVFGRTQF